MKFIYQLKPGDKVNGHEDGWMIVKFIEKRFPVKVLYETMYGDKWKSYLPDDEIETV